LKLTIPIRAIDCKAGLARRLLEELVYRFLRVAFNNQSLLLRPAFTLSTLRFWLFWHLVLLSLTAKQLVPQPGMEPGRSCGARGCKPRSSTNSDTGALHTGTVGTVPGFWLKRNIFIGNWRRRFPLPEDTRAVFLPIYFLPFKTAENFIDRRHWRTQLAEIAAAIAQTLTYVLRRQLIGACTLKNVPYGVGESQPHDVASEVRQRPQVNQDFIKVQQFCSDFREFIFKVSALIYQRSPLCVEFRPRPFKILGVHSSGAYHYA